MNHLWLALKEGVVEDFTERHGFRSDDVFEGASLYAGKHCKVEQGAHRAGIPFGVFNTEGVFKIMAQQDNASPGATKGFMCGGSYDMAMVQRIIE